MNSEGKKMKENSKSRKTEIVNPFWPYESKTKCSSVETKCIQKHDIMTRHYFLQHMYHRSIHNSRTDTNKHQNCQV